MSRGTRNRLFRAETLMLGLFLASFAAAVVPARADDDDDDPGFLDRWGDSIRHSLDSAKGRVGLGPKPDAPPPLETPSGCPSIAILDGTTSQRVMAAGALPGNQGVRYQYTLASVGRQCNAGAGRIAIKVAADGRVLLGPAGAAGAFAVPIRVVVFNERTQKPQASKLYKVPASIGTGQEATPFQFVSDDIVVPVSGDAAREYSIKIGIDAAGGGGDAGPARKTRHRKSDADSASR